MAAVLTIAGEIEGRITAERRPGTTSGLGGTTPAAPIIGFAVVARGP